MYRIALRQRETERSFCDGSVVSQWGGWREARSHRALQTISTLEDFILRAMGSQLKALHGGVK